MNDLAKANCNCDEAGSPACPAHPKCPDACPVGHRKPAVTLEGYVQLPGGHENTTVLQTVVSRDPQ